MKNKQIDTSISKIEKSPDIPTLVMNQIIDLISHGKLKLGDKLPSEHEMTKLFGISRISLREAMKLLEAKGYIESRDRRGKFVKSLTDNVQSSLEDLIAVDHKKIWELLAVRRLIDAEAAYLAAQNVTEEQSEKFDKLVKYIEGVCIDDILVTKDTGKLYSEFFGILADSTKNTIFVHLRKSIENILTDALPYSRRKIAILPESSRNIVGQLYAIYEAVHKGDSDTAKSLTLEHIDYLEKVLRKALE